MSNTKIDQIKAWMADTFAAFNDPSRIDEFHGYFAPEFTNFYARHELLTEGWMSKAQLQALYDAGMKPNIQLRHPNVQLYDDFAVCTGYAIGSVTGADGSTRVGTWRMTSVIIPKGDSWWSVHNHWSRLETS